MTWTISDRITIECRFNPDPSEIWAGPDGNFWCRITPVGVSRTGSLPLITTEEHLIELAQQMYSTLKGCSGFRFARLGWEVAESVEISELLKSTSGSELPAGLVINRDLWAEMGSPATFVPFGPSLVWKPLEGSDYRALVKLFGD